MTFEEQIRLLSPQLSYKDIADKLGISVYLVKKTLIPNFMVKRSLYNKKWRATSCQYTHWKQTYRTTNRVRLTKQSVAWKQNNSERAKEIRKQSNQRNKKYRTGYSVRYNRNRYHNDTAFKLLHNFRRRLYQAINGTGIKKATSSKKFIGCTIEELKIYLESKFLTGMTWDNYGEWHIDHIKACAKFDLTDPEQQKECFHHTNLQPLWALDNIKKGTR